MCEVGTSYVVVVKGGVVRVVGLVVVRVIRLVGEFS